ncbi:hypothetical protein [Stackebrandtia nassauensis]|uniref:Uncharacterized protein n=1 Tax=Stackebrandtia nassauensis (strain DSM 44728 / CIP 108903 / NRRL B-16338 / NBRC 102104 / LLR-40K-21) TaxID=446470 RepID=D3Q395_STANL|nr:hypothetical protein [Stackebrandtia nassauensis]ADD40065.1 hypothetical protein Snas_0347 [Stackebrandtia nassauensis DSM 44728]
MSHTHQQDIEYLRGLLNRAKHHVTVTVVHGLANARHRLNDQGHSDTEVARMLTAASPHSVGARHLRRTLDAIRDGRIHVGQYFNGAEADLGDIIASWATSSTGIDIADTMAALTTETVGFDEAVEQVDELLDECGRITDWLWKRTG